MNGLDLSRRLVLAACKLPGVREALPGEWWRMAIVCPTCEKADRTEKTEDGYQRYSCACGTWFSRKDESKFLEILDCPDLTRADQLHNALRLADAVGPCGTDIFADTRDDIAEHRCSVYVKDYEKQVDNEGEDNGIKIIRGTGPTREAAVIAALCAALEVEP